MLRYYFTRDIQGKLIQMFDYSGLPSQPVEIYWYHYDAHGNVIGLWDKNGNQMVEYKYDAWGNVTESGGTITGDGVLLREANPFKYSSYQYDKETGFYYLKNRYYSPYLGRFITMDVGVALNLYAYTSNNPVNFIDPNGFRQVIATVGGKIYDEYEEEEYNRVINVLKSNETTPLKEISIATGVSLIDEAGNVAATKMTDRAFYLVKYKTVPGPLATHIYTKGPLLSRATRWLGTKAGVASVVYVGLSGYKNYERYGRQQVIGRTAFDAAALYASYQAGVYLAPIVTSALAGILSGILGATAAPVVAGAIAVIGVATFLGATTGWIASELEERAYGY